MIYTTHLPVMGDGGSKAICLLRHVGIPRVLTDQQRQDLKPADVQPAKMFTGGKTACITRYAHLHIHLSSFIIIDLLYTDVKRCSVHVYRMCVHNAMQRNAT